MLKLDDRDITILKVLSRNGRITKSELANRCNLSVTPCWERLKRLQDAGVIAGYRAEVELRQLVPHVTVFVTLELDSHKSGNFHDFEETVEKFDEVIGCWALGGGFDYLMQVVTPDIDSYQRLMDAFLETDIGVARYYTYIVTKPVKSAALPFDILFPEA